MADFEQKTVRSFHAVRADMEDFRRSMNDWIIFLDGTVRSLKMQIRALERRIGELEERQDMEWR